LERGNGGALLPIEIESRGTNDTVERAIMANGREEDKGLCSFSRVRLAALVRLYFYL